MKNFIIPAKQNQTIQKNMCNNAPVRQTASAVITNSAFTGSCTENPFWYQQFDLRQTRTLRGGQPIIDNDAADNGCQNVTTMKALSYQDDISAVPFDHFKDYKVLVFDLTSMQNATENRSICTTSCRTTGTKFYFSPRTR